MRHKWHSDSMTFYPLNWKRLFLTPPECILSLLSIDAGLYAHHVFKAFDANRNGAISFRVSTIQIDLLWEEHNGDEFYFLVQTKGIYNRLPLIMSYFLDIDLAL